MRLKDTPIQDLATQSVQSIVQMRDEVGILSIYMGVSSEDAGASGPSGRFVGWTHGCLDVLDEYGSHPRYGRIPTVLVGFDDSEGAGGSGPVVRLKSFDDNAILDAVLGFIGPMRRQQTPV